MKIRVAHLQLMHCTSVWGLLLLGLAQCQSPQRSLSPQAPLFNNLGDYSLLVTTDSDRAQQYFTQGLNLTYGFNHAEAERSFREAIRLDSTCAMAYWGAAHVLGTNYNAAMENERKAEAQYLTQRAVANMSHTSDWEQALINASTYRYNYEKTDNQSALDQEYANELSKVYQQFPNADDVAVWYAESLMNLHPWDLYTKRGVAKPWTPQITDLLETVMERNPNHPGANHLYIHAVEASDSPERGLASADRLKNLVPGAGHLVHMPSHIYIRTGDYHQGSEVNERAIVVDSLYLEECQIQGMYPLALYPHNIHFLAATAALEGRGELAINAAFRTAMHTDTAMMREPGWETLQHYHMIPHYLLVKFSQWNHILTLREPDSTLLYPQGVWHYARGMAFAGKNQLAKAQQALASLKNVAANPALQDITIWELNSVDQLLAIAERVLAAEILRQQHNYQAAEVLLREAVGIEGRLNYNEPPDWFFSVRHPLGVVLLEMGKFTEAEAVYREDLFFLPENGWALNGLYQSLEAQNKVAEAKEVQQRFNQAWQYADIALSASEAIPLVYQNINSQSPFGSYLASVPKISWCGLTQRK
ncbi:hypothetical protein [Tunicatimonas pelagia]|uniref:hypothetical protein n=1 Tax=Tunicatimonas pelagia TaxID=931531 RepID=UPI0026668064|nr:hypothetical protein [Tunicatimonas pelagia]WKN43843.1 hypothetical protein P0M28_02515 [Tunicatimonas pelagia]